MTEQSESTTMESSRPTDAVRWQASSTPASEIRVSWKRALLIASLALMLTGCAAYAPSSTQHSTTPPAPTPAATYSTVTALRDAFVAAGGDCDEWVEGDMVTLAAQSGDCSTSTVLSIYISEADKSTVVANLKAFGSGVHLLVGENWIINTPDPASYLKGMGGTVVTS